MAAFSINRRNTTATAIVLLLNLAAALLLGFVLAYWTWAWLGPQPEPRTFDGVEQGGSVKITESLFGMVERGVTGATPTGIAISLLGVVATEGDRHGFAIVRLGNKESLVVREGEDVAPGTRLVDVEDDHIILERNGAREILVWPKTRHRAPPLSPEVTPAAVPAERVPRIRD